MSNLSNTKRHKFALLALILGIVSIVIPILIPCAIIALVLGSIVIHQVNKNPQHLEGKGLAIIGVATAGTSLSLILLIGILIPTLTRYVGDSMLRKAEADTRAIASAIAMMYGDTGYWPIWVSGTATEASDTTYNILVSNDGVTPALDTGITEWDGAAEDFTDQLIDNTVSYPTTGRRAWRGPYMYKVTADPWGSKYMANVEFLKPAEVGGAKPMFVISAGPNKLVETVFDQTGPGITRGGDDIIFRIK